MTPTRWFWVASTAACAPGLMTPTIGISKCSRAWLSAAAVAVLPALLSPAAPLPYASLALTLGAVLINGALWTWVATRAALRGDWLAALRNE